MIENERLNWIDNAKGIAMICVMVGHLGSKITFGQWGLGFVYGFHLAVFFLLAGYTLKKSEITKEYINKKFKRLMIPYFVTCIAIIIMGVITEAALNHDASILATTKSITQNIIASFFASGAITNFGSIELGTRIGAIWFLPAMFFAIIIFQFILNKFNTTLKRILISVAIGLIGYVTAMFIWLPFSVQSAMFATPFVCAGYEIKTHDLLKKIKWPHYVIAGIILIAGIGLGYCNYGFVSASAADLVLSTIIAFAGSLLVYLLAKHVDKIKIIGYIGRISIYVMCVHLFLLEAGREWFRSLVALIIKDDGSAHISFIQDALNACIQFVLSIALAALINVIARKIKEHKANYLGKISSEITIENKSIEVLKGLFIIAMIVGSFVIDQTLKNIIYSSLAITFIFISGYKYNQEESILETVVISAKILLVPCAVYVILATITKISEWDSAWFLVMLFVTRVLYACIQKLCKKEWIISLVVIIISFAATYIAKISPRLPLRIDVALYALAIYQIGHIFNKYKVLDYIKENYIFYFALSPIWALMIYSKSLELGARNYGAGYGLAIIGAVAGTLTTYILSELFSEGCPGFSKLIADLGKASIYVFLIHALLNNIIIDLLSKIIEPSNILVLIIVLIIELLIAYGIYKLIETIKNNVKAHKVC